MEFILFGTLTREGEKVKNDSKSIYGMEFQKEISYYKIISEVRVHIGMR